jgi:hypothetical protein
MWHLITGVMLGLAELPITKTKRREEPADLLRVLFTVYRPEPPVWLAGLSPADGGVADAVVGPWRRLPRPHNVAGGLRPIRRSCTPRD